MLYLDIETLMGLNIKRHQVSKLILNTDNLREIYDFIIWLGKLAIYQNFI